MDRASDADLRWRAADLAAELLELDTEARSVRLEELAAEEQDLHRLVQSLLGYAPEADALFEGSYFGDLAEDWIGRKVGHYEIVCPLDEGGMGQVFRAVRVDDYRTQVALKIIRPERGTRLDVQRFENERQILAELDHPNIARLIDGGTEGKIPYLVMELIEGVPIDRYCEDQGLSTRERILLFMKVCSSVAALHAKLLVHRDLKPANILVDHSGEPKLLDFGIAKSLRATTLLHLELTMERSAPLTLLYASPEQVSGGRIEPASDVYSLGVLLYRLLVGRSPYPVDLSRVEDVVAAIRSGEPARPSAMAREVRGRGTTAKELTGDLDSILLRVLQKDPSSRPGSAEQLMAELQRYLRGEPVESRHGSYTYRAGKYLRRHLAEIALLLLISSLSVASTSGWWVARVHLRQAESDRERFAEIAVFLEDIFKGAAPDLRGGAELSARELLDRAKGRLTESIEQSPRVRADLSSTLAEVYRGAGDPIEARELLGQAVRLWRQAFGHEDHARLERDLHNLASIELELGNLPTAEVLFREALAMGRRLDLPPEELVTTVNSLAAVHYRRGQLEEAEALYREGLKIRERVFGPDSEAAAHNLYSLGVVLSDLERLEEAEELLRASLSIRRLRLGPEHTLTASNAGTLGRVLHTLGRMEEAQEQLNTALRIREELLHPNHIHLALSRVDLALFYADLGVLERARQLLVLAEPVLEAPGTRPEFLARIEVARGTLLVARGKEAEGVRLLRSAVTTLRSERGPSSIYTRNAVRRLEAHI